MTNLTCIDGVVIVVVGFVLVLLLVKGLTFYGPDDEKRWRTPAEFTKHDEKPPKEEWNSYWFDEYQKQQEQKNHHV